MTSRIKGITVEIGGDTTKLDQALGEVTIHTTNADGSMRGLSDILADCRAAFSKPTAKCP